MAYRVGQILYVIPKGTTRIVPVQVTEEVTSKTLEGSSITYMVAWTQEENDQTQTTTVDVKRINGEIFDTADALQKTLVERATAGITQHVAGAVAKSKEWFTVPEEAPAPIAPPPAFNAVPPPRPPAVTLTKEQSDQLLNNPSMPEAASLGKPDEGIIVQLPDGRKARAKVKLPPALQG